MPTGTCASHCDDVHETCEQMINGNDRQRPDCALLAGERPMNKSGGEDRWRVLSVQSHVVHGYVGNKAATFPLQVSLYGLLPWRSILSSHRSNVWLLEGFRL